MSGSKGVGVVINKSTAVSPTLTLVLWSLLVTTKAGGVLAQAVNIIRVVPP
jgi:hypothetical protein